MAILRTSSQSSRRREWTEQNRLRSILERRVAEKLAVEILRAANSAARGFIAAGEQGAVLALEDHAARLTKILEPHWRRTFQIFGKHFAESVKSNVEHNGHKQNIPTPFELRTEEWISTVGADDVKDISNTTKKQIRNSVLVGQQEGLGARAVARRIRDDTGGLIGKQRARVIARTETHRASQAAANDSLELLNIPELKREWITSFDGRARETHQRANAQVRAQQMPFIVGGFLLQYPGDPSGPPKEIINCRCVVGAVLPEPGDAPAVDDKPKPRRPAPVPPLPRLPRAPKPAPGQPVVFTPEQVAAQERALNSAIGPVRFRETLTNGRFLGGNATAHLTDAELIAVREYTGSGKKGTKGINRFTNTWLRTGKVPTVSHTSITVKEVKLIIEATENGLKKLPVAVDKTVYRGWRGFVTEAQRKFYKTGTIVTENAFVSTSLDRSAAFEGGMNFVIRSKSGRNVSQISHFDFEQEVLFPPGTKFKVISNKLVNDTPTVTLEEILPG